MKKWERRAERERIAGTDSRRADVAYPILRLWLDEPTTNVLRRQELALRGA